jgi:hypothetical protein
MISACAFIPCQEKPFIEKWVYWSVSGMEGKVLQPLLKPSS